MDRRDISILYIKDQQVETVKQTEKQDIFQVICTCI